MPYTFTAQHTREDTLTMWGEADTHVDDCDQHLTDWELVSDYGVSVCTWCHSQYRNGVWEAPRYLTVAEFHRAHDVVTV